MKAKADKFLDMLQRCWNEAEGVLDLNVARELLGDADAIGYWLCLVLESDLRGWHAIAAKELRRMVGRHPSPPEIWIRELWNQAHAEITSNPDEMAHMIGLLNFAKSDSVRKWLAGPFVSLCERGAENYQWFGFEGLECLVNSGGAMHLKQFIPRVAVLAVRQSNPKLQEAAIRILQSTGVELRPGEKRTKAVDLFAWPIKKLQTLHLSMNQALETVNDYPIENRRFDYATK